MPELSRLEAQQAIVVDTTDETDQAKQNALIEAQEKWIEINGRRQFFGLQRNWSSWIIAWISGLILFNMLLTILVGFGVITFESAPWFITAVTVETFLQVVGLGYVAAKFLFSKGS